MQALLRRACSLGKDQHAETLADPIARGFHDVCGIERTGRTLEKTRTIQRWQPPAATVHARFHSRGEILNGRHQRSDV
jgi:hypothetical protein